MYHRYVSGKTDEMVEQKKYHLAVFQPSKGHHRIRKMPDNPDFQAAITQSKERLQELIKERENYRQQWEQELTETRTRLQENSRNSGKMRWMAPRLARSTTRRSNRRIKEALLVEKSNPG